MLAKAKFILGGGLLLLFSACGKPDPALVTPVSGKWLVEMQLPGGSAPVELNLDLVQQQAYFLNGEETVTVPLLEREGETLLLRFPAFNNELLLQPGEQALKGHLSLVKRGYEQMIPLRAKPHPGYRFAAATEAQVDLTGRWRVKFSDEDGAETQAVGQFEQDGSRIDGTFMTPTGDYRFLSGVVDGKTMKLSTFDGAHAFLFTATVNSAGGLQGDFWSGTKWHETWTAERDAQAVLPDANALTFLKPGYSEFDFSFPNLEGESVSLSDPEFDNQVVLVTLMGTWCPNCHDEAAFLAPYLRDNQHRGLKAIALLFEHFDDFELAAEQGRAMQQKFDLPATMLIAGVSDKTLAAEALPMLNRVLAYPTLIYIGRDGVVRRIHTGFSGPGTGEYYEKFSEDFYAYMETLLNE